MISLASMLGIVLSIIGIADVGLGAYWFAVARGGVLPDWFTESTKRMPLRYQKIMAVWLMFGGVVVGIAGLAILFVPTVHEFAATLLRESHR